MKLRLTALTLFGVACLFWTSSLSAQNVRLRYRWTKGEEVRYRMTTQSSANGDLGIPIPGAAGPSQMSMNQTTSLIIYIVVDDVAADGTVTLRQTFESVRAESETSLPGVPSSKTAFDSASGAPPDPASQSIAALVGESVTVTMSADGVVGKVDGMSRIMNKLSGANPATSFAGNLLKDAFSDENLSNMFADLTPFPDRELKPGDSWDRRRSMNVPIIGKTTMVETMTFSGVENGIARIGVTRTVNQGDAINIGPVSMRIEYNSNDGELLFDVAKGRLQRTTVNTTQNMVMTFTAPNGANAPPAGFPTPGPMKSATSIVMELLPAGAR